MISVITVIIIIVVHIGDNIIYVVCFFLNLALFKSHIS